MNCQTLLKLTWLNCLRVGSEMCGHVLGRVMTFKGVQLENVRERELQSWELLSLSLSLPFSQYQEFLRSLLFWQIYCPRLLVASSVARFLLLSLFAMPSAFIFHEWPFCESLGGKDKFPSKWNSVRIFGSLPEWLKGDWNMMSYDYSNVCLKQLGVFQPKDSVHIGT